MSDAQTKAPEHPRAVHWGWITAILVSPVGIVIGLVLMARGDPNGWKIALTGLLMWAAIFVLF